MSPTMSRRFFEPESFIVLPGGATLCREASIGATALRATQEAPKSRWLSVGSEIPQRPHPTIALPSQCRKAREAKEPRGRSARRCGAMARPSRRHGALLVAIQRMIKTNKDLLFFLCSEACLLALITPLRRVFFLRFAFSETPVSWGPAARALPRGVQ